MEAAYQSAFKCLFSTQVFLFLSFLMFYRSVKIDVLTVWINLPQSVLYFIFYITIMRRWLFERSWTYFLMTDENLVVGEVLKWSTPIKNV